LSFGEVACQRQGEIIRDLAVPPSSSAQQETDDLAEAIVSQSDEFCDEEVSTKSMVQVRLR